MKRLLINLGSRLITLFTVVILTFILLHFVPGSPFTSERKLPEEIERNLFKKYGLTRLTDQGILTWIAQDTRAYVTRLAHFELGPSLKHVDRDVADVIRIALPHSAELGLWALISATAGALLVACLLAAVGKPSLDAVYGLISSVVVALPTFVFAIALISAFSLWLKWLPPALWESPAHRVLPVITLATGPFFYLSQLLLGEMRREQMKPYCTTARAKGLSEARILLTHVLRNSLNPVLGVMGSLLTALMTGSFIIETVFSIPGLGRHFVVAVIDRDYFLVTGIAIVFTALLGLFGFLSDVALWKLDPRTR